MLLFKKTLFSTCLAIGLSAGSASADISTVLMANGFGSCADMDPTNAENITSCMTSEMVTDFENSCSDAANIMSAAMLYNRLPVDARPTSPSDRWFDRDGLFGELSRFSSCTPLADAYAGFTGRTASWSGCIPDGTEGTAAHMAACIGTFRANAIGTNQVPASQLDSCIELHTTYDRLLMMGINRAEYALFRPDSRQRPQTNAFLPFDGQNRSFTWVGPIQVETGASIADQFRSSEFIRLNSSPFPYDCSIAAEAQALLTNSTPAWASCIGYSPDNVVEHFAQCVPTRAQARLDCVEGRELYENLITWANAGRRPESYQTISCDVVAAGFDRANEIQMATAAAQRAAAQDRVPSAPSRSAGQASGAGPGMILIFLLAVGALVAFLIVKRSKGAGPAADEENASVDGKPVFESADEDAYTLLETDDTTVVTWLMRQHGALSAKNFGRFVEVKPDRVSVSEIYPLPKKGNQKKTTIDLYRSETWRQNAKVYDPQKITGLRIAQSKPMATNRAFGWGYTTFTVIMDYGKTHVDLNYQAKRHSEIGNFSDTDEGMLRLVAVLKEAIQRRRDQADDPGTPLGAMSLDELKALSEEHGIDVTFGDEPDNSTSPKRPPSSQGKKSTSDDPF